MNTLNTQRRLISVLSIVAAIAVASGCDQPNRRAARVPGAVVQGGAVRLVVPPMSSVGPSVQMKAHNPAEHAQYQAYLASR
ncbi:MAG TPA: hypothetical protein VGN72_16225 [Tepidisphaeraceae bacterium]|jgi:hypothetical protein|nr:hypothetical protein [Tepidisphaeraceae bacterium]